VRELSKLKGIHLNDGKGGQKEQKEGLNVPVSIVALFLALGLRPLFFGLCMELRMNHEESVSER
jgi:hypothetical protein